MSSNAAGDSNPLESPNDAAPDAFAPPGWLTNPHLQTILPSLSLRRPLLARRTRPLLACARQQIVDCGNGVRLLGHLSTQAAAGRPPGRDLVILLHGWEGSSDSLYVLSLGSELFARGCDVFRLNFRDHGGSHHLNPELFHSCRLPEVVGAVHSLQRQHPDQRITLAGFSLGGNFALRVAAQAAVAGLRLEQVFAVCPVLSPHSTMVAMERSLQIYQHYFIEKWRRSLRLKQQLFPQLYDLRAILAERSLRTMTSLLVERYSEFPDLDAYLHGYAIVGEVLARLEVPSHVLIALDDPIIPAADLRDLARTRHLDIVPTPHGGHCGFMEGLRSASWADRQIVQRMGLAPD